MTAPAAPAQPLRPGSCRIMTGQLRITPRQCSDKGRKEINQDFHGPACRRNRNSPPKGIAIALADGVSSSAVSRVAAESASMPSSRTTTAPRRPGRCASSAERVLMATNSWLHAQTQASPFRYDREGLPVHLQRRGHQIDHGASVPRRRCAHLPAARHGAGTADRGSPRLGLGGAELSGAGDGPGSQGRTRPPHAAARCRRRAAAGDRWRLREYWDGAFVAATIAEWRDDLDRAARLIVEEAYRRGSDDNLTLQIVRIDEPAGAGSQRDVPAGHELPCPPLLQARELFEGYRIVREIRAAAAATSTSRSMRRAASGWW